MQFTLHRGIQQVKLDALKIFFDDRCFPKSPGSNQAPFPILIGAER